MEEEEDDEEEEEDGGESEVKMSWFWFCSTSPSERCGFFLRG